MKFYIWPNGWIFMKFGIWQNWRIFMKFDIWPNGWIFMKFGIWQNWRIFMKFYIWPNGWIFIKFGIWQNWLIFMKFDIWPNWRIFLKLNILSIFFLNLSRKFKFHWNMIGIMLTIHEHQCKFSTISRSVLRRMKNVQTKFVQNIETQILCSVTPPPHLISCRLWDNVEEYCRAGQATDGNMARANCMLGDWGYRHTHSQYVILIAFPVQQWLHERVSMLRYTYIASIVKACCHRLQTTSSLNSEFHFQPITGLTSEQSQIVLTEAFLTMHFLVIQIHCHPWYNNHGDKSLNSIRHIWWRRFL